MSTLFANHAVTDRLDPHGVDVYDGINLNPLEVVFVKVKVSMLQADWAAPKASQTHDRWLSHQVSLLPRHQFYFGVPSQLYCQIQRMPTST